MPQGENCKMQNLGLFYCSSYLLEPLLLQAGIQIARLIFMQTLLCRTLQLLLTFDSSISRICVCSCSDKSRKSYKNKTDRFYVFHSALIIL